MQPQMILTIPTRASGHENKPPPYSGTWALSCCGMITELFRTFWYVVMEPNATRQLTDLPQPFAMRFPRANIHELLTPDLLHQLIKGTFRDHLVQWVEDYLKETHGPSKGESILDEIDRRYVESNPGSTATQSSLASHLHLSFLVSDGLNKVAISSNGQVMTQRP